MKECSHLAIALLNTPHPLNTSSQHTPCQHILHPLITSFQYLLSPPLHPPFDLLSSPFLPFLPLPFFPTGLESGHGDLARLNHGPIARTHPQANRRRGGSTTGKTHTHTLTHSRTHTHTLTHSRTHTHTHTHTLTHSHTRTRWMDHPIYYIPSRSTYNTHTRLTVL